MSRIFVIHMQNDLLSNFGKYFASLVINKNTTFLDHFETLWNKEMKERVIYFFVTKLTKTERSSTFFQSCELFFKAFFLLQVVFESWLLYRYTEWPTD